MNWVSAVLEVCHAGVLSRCPTATYGIGTKEGKSWDTHLLFPQFFPPRFPVCFQMFKVSHVFHHPFPSFSPYLSSMFSHFSPMKFTISGAKPWWNFPSSEVSGLRFRLRDKISWMLRGPKGSERIRKARNLWCGTVWIIGHDWSLKVWMESIQVVWYESTFWIDMIPLEICIYIIRCSGQPKEKIKYAKEKTPQPPELQMQNTWKRK